MNNEPASVGLIDLGEMSFDQLFDGLLNREPLPPNSLQLFAQTDMNGEQVQQLLGVFLVKAARKIHNKELYTLTAEEHDSLRPYLQSIGYDFDASSEVLSREVMDYHPDGTPFQRIASINKWNYQFNLCTIAPITKTV